MEPISIIICDDEPHVIKTWESYLEDDSRFRIVGKFMTPEEYRLNFKDLKPDVVILDIWFGNESAGYDLLKWTKKNSRTKVIMTSVDRYEGLEAGTTGADKFLYKGAHEKLIASILEVTQ